MTGPRFAEQSSPIGANAAAKRERWRQPLIIAAAAFALTTLFAVVYTLRVGMSALDDGTPFDWGEEFARVLVHWWASFLFVPALAMLVQRAPVTQRHWVRHALVLLAGTLVVSIARSLLDPPLALLLGAPSPPWLRATRVLGAFGSFLAVVVMLHAVLFFNALNAVAALLHHDPMAADRMLTRLADLLRSVLQAPATDEHPLRAELAMLDQYLDVMSIRFGPRLVVERSVDPVLLECAVPSLVLQPLAENALEHGLWPRAGVGTLRITARSAGERLILMIEDDGVGEAADLPRELSFGIGLENTRRRLEHLYGDNATLALAPRPDGGTRVTIEMPRRVLTTDEASHA
jgi:putative effector of murein hydrolase LrgA (UPF0299 family)